MPLRRLEICPDDTCVGATGIRWQQWAGRIPVLPRAGQASLTKNGPSPAGRGGARAGESLPDVIWV